MLDATQTQQDREKLAAKIERAKKRRTWPRATGRRHVGGDQTKDGPVLERVT